MGTRRIPPALVINESLVHRVELLLAKMNRSERARVHRSLLQQSRNAHDKLVTDNRNLLSCRLTKDDYGSVLNMCGENSAEISSFLRTLIKTYLREKPQ